MILRFRLYSVAGATVVLLSTPTSDAFCTPSGGAITRQLTTMTTPRTHRRQQQTAIYANLDPDWDNKDFMESLGGGPEKMDEANAEYYKQKDNRAAMDAWRAKQMMSQQQQREQPPPPPQQPMQGEEQQQGGPSPELMKKMGLKGDAAQQRQQIMGQPPTPQMQPPQPQMQPPPPPPPQQQQQQFFDANGNSVTMPMVYDANGNLVPFNPMQQQAPQQQMQQPPPQMPPQINPGPNIAEPPLPPRAKQGDESPRPLGYNPDAYTMSNTADVYFAQLKQDSKVRKAARMSGDTETANRVFSDDSVKQLRDSWVDNPYTREQNLAEARAEIESFVRRHHTEGQDAGPKVSTGISYKEKLQQMKAKRAGGGGGGVFTQQQAPPAPPKVEPKQPPAVATMAPPKVEQPKISQPKVGGTMPPPPKVGQPAVEQKAVVSTPPPKVGTPVPPERIPPMTTKVMPPPPQPVAAAATPSATTAAVSAPPQSTDEDDVRRKVRTLQGLLLKHRGGPGFGAGRLKAPEAKRLEDTLDDVKGILRSEVGGVAMPKPVASQPVVASTPPPPPRTMPASPVAPAQATPDPLAGSVACVEAALKMYKESSPAEREAMIVPLREALMAAAGGVNTHIAEAEARSFGAAMEAGPPAASVEEPPTMGFPTTYAVTKPDEDEGVHATPAAASDNDQKLEDVYNALVNARGDGGKLGLKNISGDEATALADKLQMMRNMLLDELNNGS